METSHIHVTPMMVGVVLASWHVMMAFLHVLEMTCLRLYAQPSVLVFGPYSVAAFHPTTQDLYADILSELGTRTDLVGTVL